MVKIATFAKPQNVIDNTNTIYLGGHAFETGMNGLFHFAIAKYTSSGIPDNSFNLDGKLVTVMGADQSTIFDLFIQQDGKLLAGGQSNELSNG